MVFNFTEAGSSYQPTFDRREEEHSPGHCLLSRIVTEACDTDAMKVVDLGLGAEGYKERFGNSTRQTLDVTHDKLLEPAPSRNREVSRGHRVETVAEGRVSNPPFTAPIAERPERPQPERKAFRLACRDS